MKTEVLLRQRLLTASATALWALAAIAPARADYSNTVMSLNPVGYWRLNEPAFPVLVYPTGTATNVGSVGAAANGTYIHSPVLQQPGALTGDANPSVLFETVDQTVEIPYNAAFNPPGSFTVEFWANKTNDSTATASPLCNLGTSGSTLRYNGYLFWAGNADSRWWFRTYSGTIEAAGPQARQPSNRGTPFGFQKQRHESASTAIPGHGAAQGTAGVGHHPSAVSGSGRRSSEAAKGLASSGRGL